MDEARTPWELLYDLERRDELPDETERLRVFQEVCCDSLAGVLPAEAESWLRVAREYRLGGATAADLKAARVSAWEYLGPASCDVTNPRVAAVRALIGLLFPDDYSAREGEPARDGRFEWLSCYFLKYCNRVVDRRAEQSQLLLKLFPELEAQPAEPEASE